MGYILINTVYVKFFGEVLTFNVLDFCQLKADHEYGHVCICLQRCRAVGLYIDHAHDKVSSACDVYFLYFRAKMK